MKPIQFGKVVLYLLLLTLSQQTTWARQSTQGVQFPEENIINRLERINQLGKATGQSVSYNKAISHTKSLPAFTAETNNMEEWLYFSLEETPYAYRKISNGYYSIYYRQPTPAPDTTTATAQTGTLTGKVMDEAGEPVPGATVRVPELNKGATTGIDGDYTLELPAGTYTVTVSFVGFQTSEVTGVRIQPNHRTPLDITLRESSTVLGEVVVTANYDDASAKGLYARQKNMAAMSDGLSASMIKRTSDNNIAQSLRRVSGVTISGGKHVTVRGMSDRYNNVTLNGSTLPSTEANQRNFSFDIIPTGLVDNITISKTFTPDLPGEFSGGLVEIKTLAVPSQKFLNLSLGTGMNTRSTGKPFYMNNRYTSDWFLGGIKDRQWFAGRGNEEQSMQNAAQKNNYDMQDYTGMPTQNYSATFGLPFEWGIHQLGVVGALTYRHEENTQETLAGTFLNMQNYYKPFGLENLKSTDHTATTNIGALLNLGWKMPNHKVTLRNLFNNRFSHKGQVRFVDAGYFFNQVTYFNRPLQNTIFQTQLEGEHQLFDQKLKLTWLASYNDLKRTNPDNRYAKGSIQQQTGDNQIMAEWNNTSENSNQYAAGDSHVMYAKYRENKSNIGFNLEHSFLWGGNQHSIKAGYLGTFRNGHFDQLYIKSTFQEGYSSRKDGFLSLHDFYQPERFNDALYYVLTGNIPIDKYDGKQSIHAPYLMGTFSFFKKLQLITGVRAEINDMELIQVLPSWSDEGLVFNEEIVPRQQTDWLPSVTAIYSIITDLNLRASYAKTIARPDFRELAKLNYVDPETRTFVNSQEVNQTYIDNFDARLEWYPRPGEVLSLAYFYKKFLNPIETLQRRDNQLVSMQVMNLESAYISGIELNWRKSFGFIAPQLHWLHNLYLSGNYTYMGGNVKYNEADLLDPNQVPGDMRDAYERERVLQGLAPYTFNVGLLYESDLWGAALHYNQVGRKLIYGGRFPKYDIYEHPRGILDLQLYGRFFGQRMEVKLNATDLLNQDIIQFANHDYDPQGGSKEEGTYNNTMDKGLNYNEGDFLFSRVTKGIGLSMSVSYKF